MNGDAATRRRGAGQIEDCRLGCQNCLETKSAKTVTQPFKRINVLTDAQFSENTADVNSNQQFLLNNLRDYHFSNFIN